MKKEIKIKECCIHCSNKTSLREELREKIIPLVVATYEDCHCQHLSGCGADNKNEIVEKIEKLLTP